MNRQYEEILKRLSTARKQAGLSQAQVAGLLGLAPVASSFAEMENGNQPLSVERFLGLCGSYGVSPVWVLTGVNPSFNAAEMLELAESARSDMQDIVKLLSSLESGGE